MTSRIQNVRRKHASDRPSNLVLLVALALVPICSNPSMIRRAGAGEVPPAPRLGSVLPGVAPDDEYEAPPARADAVGAGARDVLRAPGLVRGVRAWPSEKPSTASLAIDGDADTAWRGAARGSKWEWRASFRAPVHLAVLRAAFGDATTSGVPTAYRWEARPPRVGDRPCDDDDVAFVEIPGAVRADAKPGATPSEPTRRSWFVDVDACALRLVVTRTNAGAPTLREIAAFEGARNVLADAVASDDGALDGFSAAGAIDGTYAGRWVGAPGRDRWTLVVRLPEPTPIDRVRMVLGFTGTGHPRSGPAEGVGRTYGVAFGPASYSLEASDDGERFTSIASTPTRDDGTVIPLRRRLVKLAQPRTVRALRLVMHGATGATGIVDAGATPVVREISAYRADDARAVIAAPWILSVNANPAIAVHAQRGGEIANDIYYAKFLQQRLLPLFPALRDDDRFARSLGPKGELLEAPPGDADGEVLESIEGDDEQLDRALLEQSSPPPIAVLSGSNDWEYGARTVSDVATGRKRWHWDPLADARLGGMGRIHHAVKERAVPLLGFCGGAQILALLEAKRSDSDGEAIDAEIIDSVLRRTTGQPIRGYASSTALSRAWPGEARERAVITFDPLDPLFWDVAGPTRVRTTTREFLESHVDVVRPDAFLAGGPLADLVIVAKSEFCAADVIDPSPRDPSRPDPNGWRRCATVPEVFRAKGGRWPLIGVQGHAEHPRDFLAAAPGDPPEAPADPRMFVAAAIEEIVAAYVRNAR